MAAMIAGLVLFLGIHFVPTVPRLRAALALRMGENAYRGVFSLISAAGLVLIIAGYWMAPNGVPLFAPVHAARAAAPVVVTLAFILLAAANMRTHIRRAVRHPMLIGVMLWSGVHLLSNGDLTGTILFASVFAWSVIDLTSVVQRGAVKPFVPTWKHDAIAVIAGLALAYLTMRYHSAIFNTPPLA
jgi:uncharacterized membrane protein